jgi:DNA-binding NtrC family response regulator
MKELFEQVKLFHLQHDVLLQGESGTGKAPLI